ncbi:hypothetical protein C656_13145 [Enterococcus hirae 57-03-H11]|uniref:hypothetical protein n=1 Tax=Enterococcus TaxID=1350 RepID=UPI00032EF955|nr:hypothetical protein [Enterococcus hirae]OWW46599.1 hypothetical protein F522_04700 [Enterococcus hirae 81-15-F4]OWW57423.1 hypothetical protein B645_13275 [Enterococcus hirae 88-15-E09]OWW62835.1 hypothetical protein C656_13145 [Enterococcus hirae 57-03-H11]EMF0060919.1 hypothetical protein [Enterococcus hirae]EMF0182632.1 hypothetical protein [Enterococcus hirae]
MNYSTPKIVEQNISLTEDKVVWYVVAIAILLLLAITIVGAAVLYCLTKGKNFTGSWSYVNGNGSVRLGCK